MRTLCLTMLITAAALFSEQSVAYVGGVFTDGELPGAVDLSSITSKCSGVKLTETLILTAAHCNMFGHFASGNSVVISDYTGLGSPEHSVEVKIKDFTVISKNTDAGDFSQPDLAVLTVDKVSRFTNAHISLKPLRLGDKVVIGGFGCKGLGFARYADLSIAIKTVKKLYQQYFFTAIEDENAKSKSLACDGDSGGGAYRFNPAHKQFEVVGINHADFIPEEDISVDPETGKVLNVNTHGNDVAIVVQTLAVDTDKAEVPKWLKVMLPSSVFAK